MTSIQILRGMTYIDDIFIQEAAPVEKKTKKRSTVWVRFAAAACICLAAAGLLSRQLIRPASAFVIEDGVLTAYVGEDTEVVIPDEVTKIAASAFEAAPSPECITTLHISENVSEIEADALQPLTALETVTVSEENEFFEVVDGVLARKDGTLVFDFIGNTPGKDADVVIGDTLDAMGSKPTDYSDISQVIVDNAVMEVKEFLIDEQLFLNVISVTAFGQTIEFGEHEMPMYGNLKFQAFGLGNCFVIAKTENGGEGQTYILTEQKVFEISSPLDNAEEWYNRSVIMFFAEGDTLCYERIPMKFYNAQAAGGKLEECVSKEELYRETGTVTFEGEELVYHVTEVQRICDAFDMDELYAAWCNTMKIDPNEVSLEEYLAQNATKYTEAH